MKIIIYICAMLAALVCRGQSDPSALPQTIVVTEADAKKGALDRKQVKVVNWSAYYSADELGWVANFSIENHTKWTLKDFKVKSVWGAESGTILNTKYSTIYNFVPPGESKFMGSFVFSGISSQVAASLAGIVDFKIDDYVTQVVAVPRPPTAEEIEAAKVAEAARRAEAAKKRAADDIASLKADKEGAARGNAACSYRMAVRYRDGNGVKKDLDLAKIWFSAAASAGNKDADRALKELAGK